MPGIGSVDKITVESTTETLSMASASKNTVSDVVQRPVQRSAKLVVVGLVVLVVVLN